MIAEGIKNRREPGRKPTPEALLRSGPSRAQLLAMMSEDELAIYGIIPAVARRRPYFYAWWRRLQAELDWEQWGNVRAEQRVA